jgi:hypothetical protein
MRQANTYHRQNYSDSIYKEQARQQIVKHSKRCKIGASLSGAYFKTEQKLPFLKSILAFELDKKEFSLGSKNLKELQYHGNCNNVIFYNDDIFNINTRQIDFINFDLTSVVSPTTINQLIGKLQPFKGVAFITLSEKIRNKDLINKLDLYLDKRSGNSAIDAKILTRNIFPKIIEKYTDLKLVDIYTYANKDISSHATPMVQFGFKTI